MILLYDLLIYIIDLIEYSRPLLIRQLIMPEHGQRPIKLKLLPLRLYEHIVHLAFRKAFCRILQVMHIDSLFKQIY